MNGDENRGPISLSDIWNTNVLSTDDTLYRYGADISHEAQELASRTRKWMEEGESAADTASWGDLLKLGGCLFGPWGCAIGLALDQALQAAVAYQYDVPENKEFHDISYTDNIQQATGIMHQLEDAYGDTASWMTGDDWGWDLANLGVDVATAYVASSMGGSSGGGAEGTADVAAKTTQGGQTIAGSDVQTVANVGKTAVQPHTPLATQLTNKLVGGAGTATQQIAEKFPEYAAYTTTRNLVDQLTPGLQERERRSESARDILRAQYYRG
jgi:hypothetical protein